jgi:hypothetical protein
MKDSHTRARRRRRTGPWLVVDRTLVRNRHDNRSFPVLWLVTDVNYCRQFPFLMRDRFCPLFFSLLLTAYKNGEGGLFQVRELSHANCKQHIPVPSSASTERVGEQASEITDRRDTLARVCRRSDF